MMLGIVAINVSPRVEQKSMWSPLYTELLTLVANVGTSYSAIYNYERSGILLLGTAFFLLILHYLYQKHP